MMLYPKLFLTFLAFFFVTTVTYLPQCAHAGCSHLPSVSVSPIDGDVTSFDDADQVGGLHQIDKIIQIDVYGIDALFRNVVSKIIITYLRSDGEIAILTHGKGGSLAGQVTFDEGHYLSAIEMFVDQYVQYIKLCRTDGICFGPFGYNQDEPPNRILYKQRSVIKALLGKSGNVVDKLRVYFETDKMYKAEIGEVIYQNITLPTIISDLSFESPRAKVTVDNFGSSVEQSSSVSFEETVSTYETNIVTKTKQLFGSVSLTKEPGFLVQLGVADLSATFTVGASFSTTLSESNTKEIKTAISREYTVVAPPFSIVTGQVYWRQIKYAYNWNAPVQCFFTFEPQIAVRGGTVEGNMFGTQAFPHSYVKFTQTFTTAPPMTTPVAAPLPSLTAKPVTVVIVKPAAPPVVVPPLSPVEQPLSTPSGAPMKIPVIATTMSPLSNPPVLPPVEVVVPVNGFPLTLPTKSPTVSPTPKGTTGVTPLSPLQNPPVSPPLGVDVPVVASPVGMSPMSPLSLSPISPPLNIEFPVDEDFSMSPAKTPFSSQELNNSTSGSPVVSTLFKSPTSLPTKFTDPDDGITNFPTSDDSETNVPTYTPQGSPTSKPTVNKVSPTVRPTRKPRSNIYDDESYEEKVTSNGISYNCITPIWIVGILQLWITM